MKKETAILIIGSGPAGLAMAGRLRHYSIPFEIIEKNESIAPMWRRHYDRLHLHTVKQFSHLPYMEFPADYPTYVSRQKLVNYYDSYAQKFNIRPHFGQEAISVKKVEGQWHVKTDTQQNWVSDFVVVASGINRVPHRPHWKGQDSL